MLFRSPYDPARMDVRPDELLVPMNRFRELWNLAHPDARLESAPPPAAYALAGGKYTARLGDDDTLTLDGVIEIDVFVDEYVTVLLPLEGGVLARADADGKPARVGIIAAPVAAMSALQMQQAAPQAGPAGGDASVAIYLKGKGRHRLELSVRMKLERRGGWRVASGRVPVAAATELALQVPAAATEVQLDGVKDKRLYETTAGEQVIRTALEPGGALRVQWRPKISEGQVDQGLTSQSTAVIDIQEDRVRLVWNLALQFRRSERESISFRIPAGYHVEKVEGPNVRGWQIDKESSPPRLEVSLLRTARDSESFSLLLWRPGPIGDVNGQEIEIPVIDVPEALRHTGRVTIRRSPLLDLRTVSAKGVTRTDLAGSAAASALVTGDESPLGIEPYQAYEFVTAGYDMRVAATPVESDEIGRAHV